MKLSKTAKILIGIATLIVITLPFILAMGWMAAMLLPFFTVFAENEEAIMTSIATVFGLYFVLMPLYLFIALLSLGLRIFYIIHIIKNEQGNDTIRILSAIGLMFMPILVYPVYYLLYIWSEEPSAWALKSPTTLNVEAIGDIS